MVDSNSKLIGWDAGHIFSLDFSDQHYRLTQQQIEALVAIYPAIEWDTRWQNRDAYTSDELQAFASELMYRLMNPVDCVEQEIDNCLEYPNNATFLSYAPQNPHTQPDFVPDGYPNSPFFKFGSIIPDALPEWLEDYLEDWASEMTGYEPNDVLTVINSFPLFASWQDILTSGLPRITLSFSGVGIVQIRLLLVPFGSRAIISVDVEPNIADIISNIFEGNVRSIELERDFSSIPLETDIDHIEEIVLTEDIEHTIYITFLPVVDIALLPLKYGGGIRSVTFCGEFAFGEPPVDECEIPIIIADDTFFETEYVPKIFGEYYSETETEREAQEAIYDDTPQSVAPDVPVGVPDDLSKNGLCYAINRFVELYASQKLCLIQSQNWLESLLSDMANAANDFYNTASKLILPFYSPNIFSCFVDDATAMTALQDATAIEDLACHLYEELKTVAMSQANFDAAILDAATTLSGNAQDIACLMQNDSSEAIFISFLLGYNIAINRVLAGETLDCPCTTGAYRTYVHEFSNGMGVFTKTYSGNTPLGYIDGGRLRGGDLGTTRRIAIAWDDFDMSWRVRAVKIYFERINGVGHGTNDTQRVDLRPNINSNTGATGIIASGFASNGVQTDCGVRTIAPGYYTGFRQISVFLTVSDASNLSDIYLDKIEIQFIDGFHPQGYFNDNVNWCT